MPEILMSNNLVRRVAMGALALALAACADSGDAAKTVAGGASEPEELGIRVQAAPGAALLARTRLSPSHRVEFWQAANDTFSVIEDYAPDFGEQSVLGDFRGDTFAPLYEKLAGKKADLGVLARLRAFDARPRKQGAAESSAMSAQPSSEFDDGTQTITKSVSEDAQWFLEQICQPRSARIHPDLDLCYTEALDPGYKERLWGAHGYYLFQGSLFNAASSGTAELVVTPGDPNHSKTITAGPRRVVGVALADDDEAFAIDGYGESFAIYYSFIE